MSKLPVMGAALWILFMRGLVLPPLVEAEDISPDGSGALWLLYTMRNYTSWVAARKLDPSQIVTTPGNVNSSDNVIQIDCEVWNYYVDGFSENIDLETFDMDVAQGSMYAGFRNIGIPGEEVFNATIKGEYRANGTVLNSIPISGSGNFELTYEQMSHYFSVSGIQVGSDGFLQLPDRFNYQLNLRSEYTLIDFHFDGMLEDENGPGGFAKQVAETISTRLGQVINDGDGFPVSNVLYTYFEEMFAETPVMDIIGFEPTDPTTPSLLPSSTTEMGTSSTGMGNFTTEIGSSSTDMGTSSSEDPCMRHWDYNMEHIELSEKVISILLKEMPELREKVGDNKLFILGFA